MNEHELAMTKWKTGKIIESRNVTKKQGLQRKESGVRRTVMGEKSIRNRRRRRR